MGLAMCAVNIACMLWIVLLLVVIRDAGVQAQCPIRQMIPPGAIRKHTSICHPFSVVPCKSTILQGRIAHFVVEAPMVIGHESAGQVVGVGAGVTSLAPGDRVALEPGVPCGSHKLCRCASLGLAWRVLAWWAQTGRVHWMTNERRLALPRVCSSSLSLPRFMNVQGGQVQPRPQHQVFCDASCARLAGQRE